MFSVIGNLRKGTFNNIHHVFGKREKIHVNILICDMTIIDDEVFNIADKYI